MFAAVLVGCLIVILFRVLLGLVGLVGLVGVGWIVSEFGGFAFSL